MFLLTCNVVCFAHDEPVSNPSDIDKQANVKERDKDQESDTLEKRDRKKNKKKKNKKKDNDETDAEEDEDPDSFIRGEIEEPVLDLD